MSVRELVLNARNKLFGSRQEIFEPGSPPTRALNRIMADLDDRFDDPAKEPAA